MANNSKEDQSLNKLWKFFVIMAFCLFTVIGIVMTFFDEEVVLGMRYLLSSFALIMVFIQMHKGRISLDTSDSNYVPLFNLGFIFMVLGLNPDLLPMWAIGYIFFISGAVNMQIDKKKKES